MWWAVKMAAEQTLWEWRRAQTDDGTRESSDLAMVCDDGQEGEVEGSLLKKNDIRAGMGKEMNKTRRAGEQQY